MNDLRVNYKENLRKHIIKSRSIWFYITFKREFWKSAARRGGEDRMRRKWLRGALLSASSVIVPASI